MCKLGKLSRFFDPYKDIKQELRGYGFTVRKIGLLKPTIISLLWLSLIVVLIGIGEMMIRYIPAHTNYECAISPQQENFMLNNFKIKIIAEDDVQTIGKWLKSGLKEVGSLHIAQFVLIIGGLFLALQRWAVSREDDSMTLFFEQRGQIDKQIIECGKKGPILVQRAVPKVSDEVGFKGQMTVYSELNFLELCYEKYKLRLISPQLAIRACHILQSRCGAKEFLDIANQNLINGQYNRDFVDVVVKIIQVGLNKKAEIEKLSCC